MAFSLMRYDEVQSRHKVAGVEQWRMIMKELLFRGSLTVEFLFKQNDTWCDFVRNFMVSIVVLANSSYCVLISSYNGLC